MNDVSIYVIRVVENVHSGKFIMLLVQYIESQIWATEYIEINMKRKCTRFLPTWNPISCAVEMMA